MKYTKLMAFIILTFSAGLVIAAEAPAAPAADKPVRITKVSGTVQLLKDGAVFMTIKPGDAIPADLDSGVSFRVVSGSIEVEAGGMKITGVTGSEFKPTFTNGSMVVNAQGSGSVEVKSPSGYSVVLPSGSEVKMTGTGTGTNVEVQKGRAVVTDAAGGGTQILNAGETAVLPSTPVVVVRTETPKSAPKEESQKEEVVNLAGYPPDTTAYTPETAVITTQELDESTRVTEANEVSGSTP